MWFNKLFRRTSDTQEDEMKYLVVGLGNPGPKYEETRHNIGFKVLEALAKELGGEFGPSRFGLRADVKFKGRKIILIKPDTFMNLSGKAVSHWLKAEKVPLERLLIITDDIALPFGKLRMRGKGSDGGHNGLKSIQSLIGTTQYPRLRIGVGAEFSKGRQVDYVLGEWNEQESRDLPKILAHGGEFVKSFSTLGLQRAMNQLNGVDPLAESSSEA